MRLHELTESAVPFTTSTTDMTMYDDMMKDPDYYRQKKGVAHTIITMTPDEYIEDVLHNWKALGSLKAHDDRQTVDRRQSPKLVDRYAEKMKQGEKFPMPVLDHRSQTPFGGGAKQKSFSQEGLHRAYAARKNGVTEMPVLVVDDAE